MFKRIIFWSEFPEKVDWKTIENLLEKNNLNIQVYVAVNSKKNYLFWKKTIEKNCKSILKVGAWPILEKEKGYWFSGFTAKKDIDLLDEFRGIDMKIDLEIPLPQNEYTNWVAAKYILGKIFKKGKNSEYLAQKIEELSKHGEVIVNEFPLPSFILKRWGITSSSKKVIKNIMAYTSIAGQFWEPFVRCYNFLFLRLKKPDSCSLGLIAPGILQKEGAYRYIEDFEKDLKKASKRVNIIAVYSLEAILKRNNPNAWIAAVKKEKGDQPPVQSR